MSTRVRYSKPTEGVITSKQFFVTPDGKRFQVQIKVNVEKEKHFPWMVLEEGTTLTGEGVAVNLHQAKIKAKKKLEELGVSFAKETREFEEASVSSVE